MDTYYTIEEKYLQAVDEVSYGEIPKGLQLLNEIISNDPFYARAHYQVGKIYYYEIKDYQTAGYHFKTCIELEPSFPDVYFHYLHLVVFMNMEKQVMDVIKKSSVTHGVNPADIFDLQGLFFEKNKNWPKALNAYKKAFVEVTDKKQMERIEDSLERVLKKMQKGNAYQYFITE
jgi:tetratricopeptide (TPR) repeat protein